MQTVTQIQNGDQTDDGRYGQQAEGPLKAEIVDGQPGRQGACEAGHGQRQRKPREISQALRRFGLTHHVLDGDLLQHEAQADTTGRTQQGKRCLRDERDHGAEADCRGTDRHGAGNADAIDPASGMNRGEHRQDSENGHQ